MVAPRRFLPSISSLLALEAVDRLGTATEAAQELSLTHSAVSRQLKVLEDQIGVSMFHRKGKRLILTPAGSDYAQSVRGCLQDLARASLKLKAGGSRDTLNLAIHPAFGMYWLGPRLKGFATQRPEIIVNQSTRLLPFDFEYDKFDAAIHFGAEDWPGVDYLPLADNEVIPACAPGFRSATIATPKSLLNQPLLHLESRPGAWESWFQLHGIRADRLRGPLYDQFTLMAEAAASGLGVALLPRFIAEFEFSRGRLIAAYPDYLTLEGNYYLVWPGNRETSPALRSLIQWLTAPEVMQSAAGTG